MFRITDDRNIRLTLSGTKVYQKKLPSCAQKKNYQQFQITDDRHIKLTLSDAEVYYRLNFRRGTTRDLAETLWDACVLILSCVRLVLTICNCMYNYYGLLNLKRYFPNIPKYVTRYVLAFYLLSLILRIIVLFQ